jgi:glycosyltransferase involved in cell wall biosynthesis
LVPYDVETKVRPDRIKALAALGLNPEQKHILNVGLFTPGKNQGEAFEVARLMSDYQFHFVGNMAQNFSDYWRPLLATKPANCVLWGEQEDVDRFYSAMDALLFTSTSELAPLVVKEALAWQMPVFMRNLSIYMGEYDGNPLVRFIGTSVENTIEQLKEVRDAI